MQLAFDLADEYRTPVMVLMDGILGQMMEPVLLEKKPGRKLPPKNWALTGIKNRKQNIVRSLWLQDGVLEKINERLQATYKRIIENEIRCEEYEVEDAEIVVVAYGIAARLVRGAVVKAREEGIKVGWIRPISLWPFPYEYISKAADEFKIFLTVELSCGQMIEDVKLAVAGKSPVVFFGRTGGGVPTVDDVLEKIRGLRIR
jgi:2-oxoglutarate ferredoxin oxidoreductase subunit alpha